VVHQEEGYQVCVSTFPFLSRSGNTLTISHGLLYVACLCEALGYGARLSSQKYPFNGMSHLLGIYLVQIVSPPLSLLRRGRADSRLPSSSWLPCTRLFTEVSSTLLEEVSSLPCDPGPSSVVSTCLPRLELY
jgi:hypothetical protein